MVLIEGKVSPQIGADGATNVIRVDRTGCLVTQDSHGKFYEAIKRGNVYFLSIEGANPTAYAGAAAGTPLLAIYNPTNSGKDISILQSSIGILTEGTGMAAQAFEYWIGVPSAIGTGALSLPTNMYTQKTGGSISSCFANVALTAQAGTLVFLRAIVSIGVTPGTTATKDVVNGVDLVDGAIVISPGTLLVIGAAGTGTAAKIDASIIWEEIPL